MNEPEIDPLGFTPAWFAAGILDADKHAALKAAFNAGEEPNPEHYRFGAFRNQLGRELQLTDARADELFDLALEDADVGNAMIVELLYRRDCPERLFARAKDRLGALADELHFRYRFDNDAEGFRNALRALGPLEYLRRHGATASGRPRLNDRLRREMRELFGLSPAEISAMKRTLAGSTP